MTKWEATFKNFLFQLTQRLLRLEVSTIDANQDEDLTETVRHVDVGFSWAPWSDPYLACGTMWVDSISRRQEDNFRNNRIFC